MTTSDAAWPWEPGAAGEPEPGPPPVVLVHGLGSSFEHGWRYPGWADLLTEAGRRVVGIDLLGHGEAPRPTDPAAYAELEPRVMDVVESLGVVDAVGFSLGARVVLTLASAAPERFRRVVVIGLGANLFRDDDPGVIVRALEGDAPPDDVFGGVFARLADTTGNEPRALAALLRRPPVPLTADDLTRVTCPVLVVMGDRDFAGPPDPLVDALPDARLVVLPGVDHFAAPADFHCIDAAMRFLGD